MLMLFSLWKTASLEQTRELLAGNTKREVRVLVALEVSQNFSHTGYHANWFGHKTRSFAENMHIV